MPPDEGTARERDADVGPRLDATGRAQGEIRRWELATPRLVVPLCSVAVLVLLVLAFMAHTHPVLPSDVAFTSDVQKLHSVALQRLMIFVSSLGYPPWAEVIEVAAVVALLLARRPLESLFLALTLLADGGSALMKIIVARPRPSPKQVEVLLRLGSFSFPSGHVVHYTVFYGFLAVALAACWRSSWLRNALIASCIALVSLVGLSRIYLGEHWLTDVIAGYLFGGVFLVVLVFVYRRVRDRQRIHSARSRGAAPLGVDPEPINR